MVGLPFSRHKLCQMASPFVSTERASRRPFSILNPKSLALERMRNRVTPTIENAIPNASLEKKKSNINDTVKCTFSETKQQSKVELADNDSTIGNLIRRYKLDTIFKQIKSIKDNTRGKE